MRVVGYLLPHGRLLCGLQGHLCSSTILLVLHLKKHFLLPMHYTLAIGKGVTQLPMISLSHIDEYVPACFHANTWVDDHVGFQVYSLEFYLIVLDGTDTC